MERWTRQVAFDYLEPLELVYADENAWFGLLSGGRGPIKHSFESYCLAASAAYDRVPRDPEAVLLLGDTKIRSDAELMLNFGLSGDDGDNPDPATTRLIARIMKIDPKSVVTIKDLENIRTQINRGQAADVRGVPADTKPKSAPNDTPLYGPGSLLSNPAWSPMLNDAFMLAGIHTKLLFALALSKDEQGRWNGMRQQTVANLAKLFGGGVKRPADSDEATTEGKARIARDTWQAFLIQNPGVLWDNTLNIPRVFMRELIGLCHFGFIPQFSEYQLSFESGNTSKSDEAKFYGYTEQLRSLGFHKNAKPGLIKYVSEYLFGDGNALAALTGPGKKV